MFLFMKSDFCWYYSEGSAGLLTELTDEMKPMPLF
jgi:hypothetical protein